MSFIEDTSVKGCMSFKLKDDKKCLNIPLIPDFLIYFSVMYFSSIVIFSVYNHLSYL